MRTASAGFLRQRAIGHAVAAVDREIARAGEDRARLQAIEAADRVAEMGGVGIADVLCQMREIEVLIGEMQQMPGPLPGPERAEGNPGLFLEEMQEARRRQRDLFRTAFGGDRLAREAADLRDRLDHAGIE